MAKDPYVYPGSGVLRNNLEIHDQQELSQAEADIVRASLHPFREGNTRSLRAFLGQLAGEAGHRIIWEHLDHKRSLAANVRSLNGQNDQLRTLLDAIVDKPRTLSAP